MPGTPSFSELIDDLNWELDLLAKKNVEKWDDVLIYDTIPETETKKEPEDEPRKERITQQVRSLIPRGM